jgi:hypothetical protein
MEDGKRASATKGGTTGKLSTPPEDNDLTNPSPMMKARQMKSLTTVLRSDQVHRELTGIPITGNAHQVPREEPQDSYQPPRKIMTHVVRTDRLLRNGEVGRNRIDLHKETWSCKLCIGNATINLKQ